MTFFKIFTHKSGNQNFTENTKFDVDVHNTGTKVADANEAQK